MKEISAELKIVSQWHTALNTGQVEQLVALVQPDVEVGGPRGTTRGAQVVGEWFGRANVRLQPLRFFNRGQIVVVEEQGEWLSPTSGEIMNSMVVATVFVVANGLISRLMRYDSLEAALTEGGLDMQDEVQPT